MMASLKTNGRNSPNAAARCVSPFNRACETPVLGYPSNASVIRGVFPMIVLQYVEASSYMSNIRELTSLYSWAERPEISVRDGGMLAWRCDSYSFPTRQSLPQTSLQPIFTPLVKSSRRVYQETWRTWMTSIKSFCLAIRAHRQTNRSSRDCKLVGSKYKVFLQILTSRSVKRLLACYVFPDTTLSKLVSSY